MKERYYYGKLSDRITGIRHLFVSFLSRKAGFDGESIKLFEEHKDKGTILFATYQTSNVALAFLYHLLEKFKFGHLSYAFDYNPHLLQRSSYFFKKLFRSPYITKKGTFFDTELVRGLIERGEMIAFSLLSGTHFLKRYMDPQFDTLYNFIELQRVFDKPLIVMPQVVFWHRKPEKKSRFLFTGATARRGFLSAFLSTFSPTYIHLLKPVYLNEFIESHPGESSEQLAQKLREILLEAHDNEKRLVLGPVLIPRQEMMEQILYHENVQSVIRELSTHKGHTVNSLKKESYKLYREIASDYKMSYILVFERILDWMFKKMFNGIRTSEDFIKTVREAAQSGPVVIVPNHRSHMDYLIISYLFYKNRIMPPHVAAGVNLAFFPVGNLFRHCGAFFIRRTFKDMVLYPAIFKQYLKTLISKNYHIEYFLEGGRSRTGRLLFPKPGLTSFVIEAVEEGYTGDVTFIPISICYDRILEEGAYIKEMKGHTKEKETVSAVLRARKFLKKEYGLVHVSNGNPFTLSTVNAEAGDKNDRVSYIGNRIMSEISSAVTITPLNLVATAMLCQSSRGIKHEILLQDCSLLFRFVKDLQVPLSPEFSQKDVSACVESIITRLLNENLMEVVDDGGTKTYLVLESERMLLSYYKNPIVHYMLSLSLSANILFREKSVMKEQLESSVSRAIALLVQEFPASQNSNTNIDAVIRFLCAENLSHDKDNSIESIDSNIEQLQRIGSMLQDIFESYYIVCNVLELSGKKSIDNVSVLRSANERGRALFYSEKIRFAESLCQPVFSNALRLVASLEMIEEDGQSKKKKTIIIKDLQALVQLKRELRDWFV